MYISGIKIEIYLWKMIVRPFEKTSTISDVVVIINFL